jgi:Fe2+ or Zn2+ uptake regulation protein
MLRQDLYNRVKELKEETKIALQTVYNELNHGQQQKILKNEEVKALFERYGVEV